MSSLARAWTGWWLLLSLPFGGGSFSPLPSVVVCPNPSSSGGSHSTFSSSSHLAGGAPPPPSPVRCQIPSHSVVGPPHLRGSPRPSPGGELPLVARSEPIGSGSSPPPGVVAFPPPVASFFSRWTRFDPVPSPSAVGHPPFPLMGYFAISLFSLACSFFFRKNCQSGLFA